MRDVRYSFAFAPHMSAFDPKRTSANIASPFQSARIVENVFPTRDEKEYHCYSWAVSLCR